MRRLDDLPMLPFSDAGRTWLNPIGITAFSDGCQGMLRLAGGVFGFTHLDVINRMPPQGADSGGDFTVVRLPADQLLELAAKAGGDALSQATHYLDNLTKSRGCFAKLPMDKWHIMGIVNTTPDSFSDGGDYQASQDAIAAAKIMQNEGAAIVDIGGESTRPGAAVVGYDEECRRILPVIESLAKGSHCISADTRHTPVMSAAIESGAMIINDVGGLRDAGALDLLAAKDCPVIIMHMQGEPGGMQKNPHYDFAPTDVFDWLEARIKAAIAAGIKAENIAIDPGFGFGKSPHHNMQMMGALSLFHGLGTAVVLGVSRKSTLAHFSKGEPPKDRVAASVALAAAGRLQGVQIFRVHDVAQTHQALANIDAMAAAMI